MIRNILASLGFWQGAMVISMPIIALLSGAPVWAACLIALLALTLVAMNILYQVAVRKSVKKTLRAFKDFTGRELRCRGIGLRYYLLCVRRAIKEMGALLKEARESENEALQSISSTGYGVLVLDSGARITLTNERAKELIGAEEGRRLWETHGAAKGLVESAEQAIASRTKTSAEFLAVFPERKWLRADIVPWPRDRFLIMLEDITPLKDTEGIKSRLVSSASHELRTPLTVIQGYLELASGPGISEEARVNALETALKHTKRLSKLVDDILTLSRMESIPPRTEPVDPRKLISDAQELFRPRAREKGLELRVSSENLPAEIRVDPGMIETALYNLLDNAIKFTQRGFVELKAWAEGSWLYISVADSGPGIPPDDLPRIFERFYKGRLTSQAEVPGTGLGLSIAKWAVSAHGGEILAESKVGEGSRFTLKLPLG